MTSLMGMARLMTMAFQGVDLSTLSRTLVERACADDRGADALMDLSTVLHLRGNKSLGIATQALALQIKRLFELPASRTPAVRLLAIMAPGDLMTNAPLPFLIEDSDISLSMLYLLPGEPIPDDLPAHDVAFIAVSESGPTRGLLDQLAGAVPSWSRPVINRPERILRTSRAQACEVLMGAPGICMPATVSATRDELQRLALGEFDLGAVLPGGVFPLIVRPVDSHAGQGLEKVDAPGGISKYLEATAGSEFFISRFIDYRGEDGLFRKYRVVLVDGQPFAGHMGVSANWMIHYLNAGMTESAWKRAEEERFMGRFEADFARRHGEALRAIAERFGLEYLVIDCGETADGELLVFEVDPGAVVHAMDPVDLFPYKPAAMQKVFDAFRAMLMRAVKGG
jgi:glutathione synthase/RimK-type ligase-like ATP-grasp enzyme